MSGSKEVILRAAYTDLLKAEQCGDFERGLKTCNRILKTWPNAKEAFRCKIVCLVQLSKFADALTVIKKAVAKLQHVVQFEKAYCEYRENRAEDALGTLEALGDSLDTRGLELLAQLYYRLERYAQARPIYQRLLKETADEYDDLRTANLQATEVQMLADDPELGTADLVGDDSYEQLYNEACRLLGVGDASGALKSLKKAESVCRAMLAEEDCPEEEVEEEVAVIRAQAAYAHHRLGHAQEAASIYQDILNKKPGDLVVAAVVSTNLVALKGGEANLFDTRKKLKAAATAGNDNKLAPSQKQVVAFNNALLQLHSNQFEPCRRGINELRDKFGAEEDAVVLETALLIRQKDVMIETAKATEVLEAWKSKVGNRFPTDLQFALAQLHLIEGNVDSGVSVIEAIGGGSHSLGPLSLIVALRLFSEQGDAALQSLSKALSFWRSHDKGSGTELMRLMEEAAGLHLRLGQTEAASKLLEELRRRKPDDPAVLASLIQAYAKFNPAKAEEMSESLAGLGEGGLVDSSGVDVEALEEGGGLALSSRYKKKDTKPTPKDTPKLDKVEKRKKKRKIRLPKDFDPGVAPDPERWLPRYERSTNRRRKDKKRGEREIGRGAQGAVSGAAADLDMSAKGGSGHASPKVGAGPSPAIPAGPRQQRPGGQAKAKKKPGKKGGKGW